MDSKPVSTKKSNRYIQDPTPKTFGPIKLAYYQNDARYVNIYKCQN
jgi:hypothetical protein